MKTYRSHKLVEAARIEEVQTYRNAESYGHEGALLLDGGERVDVTAEWLAKHSNHGRISLVGGYLVRYADGYTSWSPPEAFEEGYTDVDEEAQAWEEEERRKREYAEQVNFRASALNWAVALNASAGASLDKVFADAQRLEAYVRG